MYIFISLLLVLYDEGCFKSRFLDFTVFIKLSKDSLE